MEVTCELQKVGDSVIASVGAGIWDLGFGVWDLRFGIWGWHVSRS